MAKEIAIKIDLPKKIKVLEDQAKFRKAEEERLLKEKIAREKREKIQAEELIRFNIAEKIRLEKERLAKIEADRLAEEERVRVEKLSVE